MKWTIQAVGIIALAGAVITACNSPAARAGAEPATQSTLRSNGKSEERSAREVRGATPYLEVKNEPPPKLIVDPPLPDLLDQGVVWIQWRVENLHIAPVFGEGALQVSPRVGHLHIQVDDLPWWWADPSNINTIDMAGLPPGPHKVKISLVNANHEYFPGQSKTVSFVVPERAAGGGHGH